MAFYMLFLPMSRPFMSHFCLHNPPQVRGYGLSGDGHHITQPHPEGLGGQLCMHRALKGSGVRPEQVVYINAHATSTPIGGWAQGQS